jgi:hypothetical protein
MDPCIGGAPHGGAAMMVLNDELFDVLKKNEVLRAKGFSVAVDREGGIVVDRAGHVHGIWNHDSRGYAWISPGNSEPKFRTEDLRSAVLYTVVVLAQE